MTDTSRSLQRPDSTVSRASDARNRYKIRYTRTQHRPTSRQVNDHGRVSGTHRFRTAQYRCRTNGEAVPRVRYRSLRPRRYIGASGLRTYLQTAAYRALRK